jgi:hypothetical protein
MKLIKLINNIFKTNFETSLELYINSKSPLNTADVEKYQREYFDKKSNGYFYC